MTASWPTTSSALLLDFGQRDRAWRIDWHDDQQHRYLVDILADLETSAGDRRFRVMLHLGNYALWLAGLFPDYIAARHLRKAGPDVTYYDTLGRRGFGMASDHALASEYGLGDVLRTAAERFPSVRERAQRPERPAAVPERVHAGPDSPAARGALGVDPSSAHDAAARRRPARPPPPAPGTARAPAPPLPRAFPPGATAPPAATAPPPATPTASINPSALQPDATSPPASRSTAW